MRRPSVGVSGVAAAVVRTTWGEFLAIYSPSGLNTLKFPGTFNVRDYQEILLSGAANELEQQLEAYISGDLRKFSVRVDLSGGTEFSQMVWQQIRKIGYGKFCSYGEIAGNIGKPKAYRAIGNACGANPLPIIIPCHRVLGKNSVGGYSGGLEWKKRLLALEGISF